MTCQQKNSRLTYGIGLSRQLDAAMLQLLHPLLQVSLLLHERGETLLELLHGDLQGLMNFHWHSSFWRKKIISVLIFTLTNKQKRCDFLTRMLVSVVTVSVLVRGVIVLVVFSFMALVLLLKSEGHSSLLPGCQVKPVFFLQLPPGLVPLCFHLSQSSPNKLLLWWVKGRWMINVKNNSFLRVNLNVREIIYAYLCRIKKKIWNLNFKCVSQTLRTLRTQSHHFLLAFKVFWDNNGRWLWALLHRAFSAITWHINKGLLVFKNVYTVTNMRFIYLGFSITIKGMWIIRDEGNLSVYCVRRKSFHQP